MKSQANLKESLLAMFLFRSFRSTAIAAAFLLFTGTALAGLEEVRRDVTILSSEEFGGRFTGSEGEALASAHIIEELKKIGAVPLPGMDGFLQPFDFDAGTTIGKTGNSFRILGAEPPDGVGEQVFTLEKGFAPLSFSENGELEAEVVFAGYGLRTPESASFSYDSYFGLDVTDKFVLVFRYSPEDAEPSVRQQLNRYAALRYKALIAREKGAKGLIIVSGPNSSNAGKLIPSSMDTGASGSSILAVSVTGDVANAILAPTGKTLAELQTAMDTGNPHVQGMAIPDMKIRLSVNLEVEKVRGNNVLAWLPPTVEDGPKELVALGAHYDHLGRGLGGGSLARNSEQDAIHYGADDNASGTSAILEAARIIAATQPERERGYLFGFWSGEEIGLLGSQHYANNMPMADYKYLAYINADMVGRMQNNNLVVQGTGSSPQWEAVIEQANAPLGLDLTLQEDPMQPTDSQTFYLAGIPALEFFTGLHEDYHRPSDTADKVSMEGVQRSGAFAASLAMRVAGLSPTMEFVRWRGQRERPTRSAGVRAYTGVIPDYTANVTGLRLSSVTPGGPADQAGLLAGDVVVRLGNSDISNIYDYTYALDSVKIGEPLEVIVDRDGTRKTLTLTPARRE